MVAPFVRGERTSSIAITEPGAGWDAGATRTTVVEDGSKWQLHGQERFISDGYFLDFFVVSRVTEKAAGHKGISLFLVDKDVHVLR